MEFLVVIMPSLSLPSWKNGYLLTYWLLGLLSLQAWRRLLSFGTSSARYGKGRKQHKTLGNRIPWSGQLLWSIFMGTGQERFLLFTVGLMTTVNQGMMMILFHRLRLSLKQ